MATIKHFSCYRVEVRTTNASGNQGNQARDRDGHYIDVEQGEFFTIAETAAEVGKSWLYALKIERVGCAYFVHQNGLAAEG
jgi:hypothetical protein